MQDSKLKQMKYTSLNFKLAMIQSLFYTTWLGFIIRYRKTMLGPLWIVIGPSLFIITLGSLFSDIGGVASSVFVPHMAIGLVVWTLISGFVTGSANIFQRAKSNILQGSMQLSEIVIVDVFTNFLIFAHQLSIILVVFLIYNIEVKQAALLSVFGLILIFINGIWLSYFFGILGARYRDLTEVVQAVMRIAFLATPIIWIPGDTGRGGALSAFTTFNPFFHFLELVRSPLLGNAVAPLSWIVVILITVLGGGLALWFRKKFSHLVALWV